MLVRKCDRCGKFYEPYDLAEHGKGTHAVEFFDKDSAGNHWSRESFDLCSECANSLNRWIKNPEREEKR